MESLGNWGIRALEWIGSNWSAFVKWLKAIRDMPKRIEAMEKRVKEVPRWDDCPNCRPAVRMRVMVANSPTSWRYVCDRCHFACQINPTKHR